MTTTVADRTPATAPEYGVVAKLSAEAFGTFLLVFGALGVALFSNPSAAPIPTPLALGLALAVGIAAVGHVSGGHFNPAVTLGLAVAGRTNWRLVPGYIAAQLVGGLLGALVLWVSVRTLPNLSNVQTIFSQLSNGFGEHSPNQFPLAAGLLAEVVSAGAFVAVVLAVTSRRAIKGMAPWAIGLGLAVLVQGIAPITNAGLNPARSTATAVFAEPGVLAQLWLFWVAPILGAVIVGLIFRGFGSPEDLHRATAGALADVTAEATRDDGARASDAAVAAAAAETAEDAAAAEAQGETAGTATAEPQAAQPQAAETPAAETPRSPEDDARDFFDKNR
ncbi:aquaporin [Sinomonas mesophila]|uniref:aquaporin n=1 Tax=Sinomonas mesophila TaxID=1531955 RepID=UPI0009842C6F|nr:aquaporin [Sinomonas mesophila]